MVNLDIDKQSLDFKDFISFDQAIILDINSEQRYLVTKYHTIIKGLRQRNLTVKEIHQLYWEPRENKPTKTLKTVYRYLDLLEEHNLVVIAGQRMTRGRRVTEKIYCLTAQYFHDSDLDLKFWDTPDSELFAKKVGILLSDVLQNKNFKKEESYNLIHHSLQLSSNYQYFNILEIIDKIRKSPELQKSVESAKFDEHTLISYTSQLLVLIRNFGAINQLLALNNN